MGEILEEWWRDLIRKNDERFLFVETREIFYISVWTLLILNHSRIFWKFKYLPEFFNVWFSFHGVFNLCFMHKSFSILLHMHALDTPCGSTQKVEREKQERRQKHSSTCWLLRAVVTLIASNIGKKERNKKWKFYFIYSKTTKKQFVIIKRAKKRLLCVFWK